MLQRLTDPLDFQARALDLRSERQRLIASNIANADTPGYVARDLNFAKALLSASAGASGASTLATDHAGHIAAGGNSTNGTAGSAGRSGDDLVYAVSSQTSLDRNTVDMDRERAGFADNAVKYEATLRFITSHVRTTLSAITGQ